MSDALFSCQNGCCRDYVSYPSEDLRMAGEVRVCEGCYDSGDCDHLVESGEDEYLSFYELPPFVTDEAKEITKLKAELEELKQASWAVHNSASLCAEGVDTIISTAAYTALLDVLNGAALQEQDQHD